MNLLELNMVSAVDIDLKFQFNPSSTTRLHSTVANIKIQKNFKIYFTSKIIIHIPKSDQHQFSPHNIDT